MLAVGKRSDVPFDVKTWKASVHFVGLIEFLVLRVHSDAFVANLTTVTSLLAIVLHIYIYIYTYNMHMFICLF